MSIIYSHPQWLVSRLIKEKGILFTKEFLISNNNVSDITLYVNTLLIDFDNYKKILMDQNIPFHSDTLWPKTLCYPHAGKIDMIPGYSKGYFYVQDPAAHEVAAIAGLTPGMRVLDCCAAPGGKTISAAIMMNNSGNIDSWDIHANKLKRIQENCERLHISIVNCAEHDAREPVEGSFDVVFADVPCSGMGVIRKRPEIRYKSEDEVCNLPAIQESILDNISNNVIPGGILIYSTCTIIRQENEDVIQKFLDSHPEFSLEPFSVCGQNCDGMFTFWPHIHHTDGFFICKMKKKS